MGPLGAGSGCLRPEDEGRGPGLLGNLGGRVPFRSDTSLRIAGNTESVKWQTTVDPEPAVADVDCGSATARKPAIVVRKNNIAVESDVGKL